VCVRERERERERKREKERESARARVREREREKRILFGSTKVPPRHSFTKQHVFVAARGTYG